MQALSQLSYGPRRRAFHQATLEADRIPDFSLPEYECTKHDPPHRGDAWNRRSWTPWGCLQPRAQEDENAIVPVKLLVDGRSTGTACIPDKFNIPVRQ